MRRIFNISAALFIAFIFITSGCIQNPGSIKTEPEKTESNHVSNVKNVKLSVNKGKNDIFQVGTASWYGDKFHGRRTSNGEIYDMNRLTAAHKELPFNTIVEVENLDNRKRVLVRINDRGPFVKDRIIDLSYKAAKELGMDEIGTAPVVLRIVKTPGTENSGPIEYSDKSEIAGVKYYLQVGAFKDIKNAEAMLFDINEMSGEVVFKIVFEGDYYKVVTDLYELKNDLLRVQKMLIEKDFNVILREKHQ